MDVNLYDLGAKVGAAAVTQNDAVEAEQDFSRSLEVTGLADRADRTVNNRALVGAVGTSAVNWSPGWENCEDSGVLRVRSRRVPSGTGSACR